MKVQCVTVSGNVDNYLVVRKGTLLMGWVFFADSDVHLALAAAHKIAVSAILPRRGLRIAAWRWCPGLLDTVGLVGEKRRKGVAA